MDKLPFSVYDFFGHLAPGFILLAAIDYSFDGGWLLRPTVSVVYGVLWTVIAYIVGHIIATVSGNLLERKFVHGLVGPPEDRLLEGGGANGWRKLFPGYYRPLPDQMRDRILARAKSEKPALTGHALFLHCRSIAQADKAVAERLHAFQNVYGFCRNTCLSLLIVACGLTVGAFVGNQQGHSRPDKLWWAAGALVGSVGMLYRYLKYFRKYTSDALMSYAEENWRAYGANSL